jgi:hypothetical protein
VAANALVNQALRCYYFASDNPPGAKYNERADKRSWTDVKTFFVEIFR